jgi:hypothetical protein
VRLLGVAVVALLASACASPPVPHPTAANSTTEVAPFQAVLRDGAIVTVSNTTCDALRDTWLIEWCSCLFSFDIAGLPESGEDFGSRGRSGALDASQLLDASVAFALLRHDFTVCDNVVIATLAASVVGPAATDLAQKCREVLTLQAAKGEFSFDSPNSEASLRILLP